MRSQRLGADGQPPVSRRGPQEEERSSGASGSASHSLLERQGQDRAAARKAPPRGGELARLSRGVQAAPWAATHSSSKTHCWGLRMHRVAETRPEEAWRDD